MLLADFERIRDCKQSIWTWKSLSMEVIKEVIYQTRATMLHRVSKH